MKIWTAIILFFIGTAFLITTVIFQIVLSIQKFGVIFNRVLIPHWSLWFILIGSIFMFAAYLLYGDD